MKTCKYCHWQYDIRLETDAKRREAQERGFCGPPCVIAWDAEKARALDRERDRWRP